MRVSQRVMGAKRKTARRPTSPKTHGRKLEEKVFRRLGVDSRSQSSRAQRRAGDERDAKRAACLRENFEDDKEIPKFLTVPISEWCAPPAPVQLGYPARLPRIRRASGASSR